MNILRKLERKLGFLAVPNLMLVIVGTMFLVFALELLTPQLQLRQWMGLDWSKVLQGEVWRVFTFLFIPPPVSAFWIIISLYFYYWIGSSLEQYWGTFSFNCYYFIGAMGAIATAALTGSAENMFLNLSLFFSFAILNPDVKVLLFFVIPVKIKYLAYANAVFFLIDFIVGTASTRVGIVLSLVNLLLFFGGDLYRNARLRFDQRHNRRNWRNLN